MAIMMRNIKRSRTLAERKILFAKWLLTVGAFAVTINASTALGQDLRLEISVPKAKIGAREPVNLTVKLVNASASPYYVSSDISLGTIGIGHEFGTYELQFRRSGASEFVRGPGTAGDGIPPRNLSGAAFIAHHQLVLLQEGMFVGRTISSDWDGLTLLAPGRYSIRVTYTTYGNEREIPQDLRFPVFRSRLVSNVLDLEIQR